MQTELDQVPESDQLSRPVRRMGQGQATRKKSLSEVRIEELNSIKRSSSVKEIRSRFKGNSKPETEQAFQAKLRGPSKSDYALGLAMQQNSSPDEPEGPNRWTLQDKTRIMRDWSQAIEADGMTQIDAEKSLEQYGINESSSDPLQWAQWQQAMRVIASPPSEEADMSFDDHTESGAHSDEEEAVEAYQDDAWQAKDREDALNLNTPEKEVTGTGSFHQPHGEEAAPVEVSQQSVLPFASSSSGDQDAIGIAGGSPSPPAGSDEDNGNSDVADSADSLGSEDRDPLQLPRLSSDPADSAAALDSDFEADPLLDPTPTPSSSGGDTPVETPSSTRETVYTPSEAVHPLALQDMEEKSRAPALLAQRSVLWAAFTLLACLGILLAITLYASSRHMASAALQTGMAETSTHALIVTPSAAPAAPALVNMPQAFVDTCNMRMAVTAQRQGGILRNAVDRVRSMVSALAEVLGRPFFWWRTRRRA